MPRIKLNTWANKSDFEFTYEGEDILTGMTIIHYGKNKRYKQKITADQYHNIIERFRGQTLPIGTSKTDPPRNSLGFWLNQTITRTAIASYVGPILVHFGYAEKRGAEIIFRDINLNTPLNA
jgi:hypothetical protein